MPRLTGDERRQVIDGLTAAIANLRRAVELIDAKIARCLRCAECGRLSDHEAHGWRSYLTDDEPPLVEHFCPTCAEEEFGDD
jgi:hypothetical protein